MMVRWGNVFSESFKVSNRVRQGGILSLFLFNIYFNDLSIELNSCRCGCMFGSLLVVNHIMYAEDLVVFCPYSADLQNMLCSRY